MKQILYTFISTLIVAVPLLSGQVSFAQNTEDFQYSGSRIYSHNEKGECIGKRSFDDHDQLVSFAQYVYDFKGHKVETLKYSADSILQKRYIYSFVDDLKTQAIKLDYTKGTMSVRLYLYDSLGNSIETQYYDQCRRVKTLKSTYTAEGEVATRTTLDGDNAVVSEVSFEYTMNAGVEYQKKKFDGNGKLTTTSTSHERNNNGDVTIYDIEYSSSRKTSKRRNYIYSEDGLHIKTLVYEKKK